MPCKRDRHDIKRIETVANSALLILGVSRASNEVHVASQYLMEADKRFVRTIVEALHRVPFTELTRPLYHFTDMDGLKGILQTRSLWASLAMALEDISEIKYALECSKRIIEHSKASSDSSFFDEIIPLLNLENSRIIDTLGMKTYIVSLRSNVDASAHWEKYGRAGKGFAIAFALKHLVIPGVLPLPVLYDPAAQDNLIHEFIESNMKLFCELKQKCPRQELLLLRQRAIQFTAFGLWTLAPVIKNSSYIDEQEWRLIVVDLDHVQVQYGKGLSNEVRVRRYNNRNIPYKLLKYDALPIVGLELGPNTEVTENDAILKQLLKNATFGFDVPITRSQLPVGYKSG